MIKNNSLKINFIIKIILFLLVFSPAQAQLTSGIFSGDVTKLTDEQISTYWQQARAQGYTLDQIKAVAAAKGLSSSEISTLERRLKSIGTQTSQTNNTAVAVNNGNKLELDANLPPAGLSGNELKMDLNAGDPLFGYDFFNNTNISFAPNLNLATPANYELGPGDELVINIYGAAEFKYDAAVDREGAIRLQNIGPVYVSGLTIDAATKKIEGSLRRIYQGISAPASSPYKVFVGVSLAKVRTVQVNIIGEVKVPGTYALSSLSTVLNALYAAGGPTREGTFRDIKLVRGGTDISHFDIYKFLVDGSQVGNRTLQDQDVLIISPYLSRVSIFGSVKRPGIYELKPDENLNDLLNFSSGFTSIAYKDKIVLERIEGDRRVVKEINLANAQAAPLEDGDVIQVNEIIDKFINRISIEGSVYRPGNYELTEGTTLANLIEKAAGLTEDAFLDRGLLIRTEDGVTKTVTPFSVAKVLNNEINFVLQPNDVVRIFSKYGLREDAAISIDGAVNDPNTFPFFENLTIEDLVILAGGFKDGANVNVIDIFRKVQDDQFETLSKNFKITANGGLVLEDGSAFKLEPNDRVSVRFLKGIYEQKNVSVSGEVNYPGSYAMENKTDRISDLVEKSGGISPFAFVQGATLIRRNPYYVDRAQQITTDELGDKVEVNSADLNNQQDFAVGINLADILAEDGESSKSNLILQDGDQLIIPSMKETVKVEGEVLVSSMIRFEKSHNLKDYINKSGGFSSEAKKGKTYVVYSNGDIAATRNFLFFRSYPKVKPGAVVLVPTKKESKRTLSTQEVIGISTGLATFVLLIERLVN